MWIKTTAQFRSGIPDVEWEMLDEEQQYEATEPREFRFNTDDVFCYNESRKENAVTVHFKHSHDYSLTVNMTYQELDKIIFNFT